MYPNFTVYLPCGAFHKRSLPIHARSTELWCLGTHVLTIDRWNRAERLGLAPPPAILRILLEHKDANESLWHERV